MHKLGKRIPVLPLIIIVAILAMMVCPLPVFAEGEEPPDQSPPAGADSAQIEQGASNDELLVEGEEATGEIEGIYLPYDREP